MLSATGVVQGVGGTWLIDSSVGATIVHAAKHLGRLSSCSQTCINPLPLNVHV